MKDDMLTPGERKELSLRVRKGARLLDANRPTWWKSILRAAKREEFSIDDPYMCVLGHAYRRAAKCGSGFDMGLFYLGVGRDPEQYGFDIPFDALAPRHGNAAGSYLEEAWLRLARNRERKSA